MNDVQTGLASIFGSLAVVLCIASVIGYVMHRRQDIYDYSPTIQNLNARIMSWWVMTAFIGFALIWGRTGVVLLIAFAAFSALREIITLSAARRADHLVLATVFYVVLPLQFYFLWIDWYGMYTIFIPVYAYLLLPIIAVLRGETDGFLMRIAEVQWSLMIAVYCVSHVPALLSLEIDGYAGKNILLIAFLVVVAQSGDVLQYIWGKLLGKTPIAPKLSRSKTIGGFVGGVASSTLIGASLWWITPFTFLQAGGLALVISLLGFSGGLVMTAIKRDRGVKAWAQSIKGHGGFMDRLDSVIFSAPIFFHLVRFWWTV